MDWKDKLNALRSEVPQVEHDSTPEPKPKQKKVQSLPLRIELDKRKGKLATLITEFEGNEEELKILAKVLKDKCASGGSQRDGEILIQGDFRVKISEILQEMGYKIKKINFK
ncbi:MAG: translation initiation factor [Porphyromonadaceae bacterium]|nr:translation initiation factor [Porphyromonadaceae bacterium]